MRVSAILREAVASARSQAVASVLAVLVIAGMVVAVMLTTGRTVGAERQVLDSLDQAGTRSVVIHAEDAAGVTSDVLNRIGAIDGIEWAAAFTAAVDATNSGIPTGARVPARYLYSSDLEALGIPAQSPDPGRLAYASRTALERLGITSVAGGIALSQGMQYNIGGVIQAPDFLDQFEPLVLIPKPDATGAEPVNIIVVLADAPELVAPVSTGVLSVLDARDPSRITVATSEALAEMRGIIEGQLSTFSRGLVVALLAVSGVLVSVILYGLVMLRRKDFGRRRALGASRGLIVGLLLAQTGMLAGLGTCIGLAVASSILLVSSDPLPEASFVIALGIATIVTATVSALIPALGASRREPIRELRVP